MINEAQRLHEEFAQTSMGDSMTVGTAASGVLCFRDIARLVQWPLMVKQRQGWMERPSSVYQI